MVSRYEIREIKDCRNLLEQLRNETLRLGLFTPVHAELYNVWYETASLPFVFRDNVYVTVFSDRYGFQTFPSRLIEPRDDV